MPRRVRQPVKQRAGETLRREHAGPFVEWQVARDDGRAALVALAEHLEQQLAADRTSCCHACANQFRLMLHTGAYWLLWSLRSLMPRRSTWRVAQFDTLRLRLVKLATRVVAPKTGVMLHLPSACPDKAILRLALERLPRLTC